VTVDRDASWKAVWNHRDADRADWNGYEACFSSPAEYARWVQHVSAFICDHLQLESRDVVADLGCGTGRFAENIGPVVKSMIAIDYSKPAIELARVRRPGTNITYRIADLNSLVSSDLGSCTKAYSVGSFMYLTSVDRVFEILSGLVTQGISVLAIDLPDARLRDERERGYDRGQFSHLEFRAEQFLAAFPGARVMRGVFPEYVNDAVRFSVHIPAGISRWR
jgi:SAM-dependent methyltransferase